MSRVAGSPSVAVVGGGASGTLAAIHLLRRARAHAMPLEIVMIDQYGRHALGQAYSTTDPHHLLNACAGKMSAIEGDPGHLLRWARDNGLDIADSDYLPRQAYGRYLRDTLAAAEERPIRVVRRVTGRASALTCDRGRAGPICRRAGRSTPTPSSWPWATVPRPPGRGSWMPRAPVMSPTPGRRTRWPGSVTARRCSCWAPD